MVRLFTLGLVVLLGCTKVRVNPLMEAEIHAGLETIDTIVYYELTTAPRIEYLIVHCTANVAGSYYPPAQAQRDWNRRGFNGVPGYHWMIQIDGRVDTLRKINPDPYLSLSEIVYSARGYNNRSLALSYVGGTIKQNGLFIATDTRTLLQKIRINEIVADVKRRYPWIKVVGHQNLTAKACPSFDAKKEFQ